MSRSGRHETLLSIYGAAESGTAVKRLAQTSKKPTRPPSSSSSAPRLSSRREWTRRVSARSDADAVALAVPSDAACGVVGDTEACGEGTDDAGVPPVETTNNNSNSSDRQGEPKQTETPAGPADATTTRSDQPEVDASQIIRQVQQRKAVDNSLVLSFYGDGFLEVRLKPESQQLMAPPRDGLEGGSFTIELLVFKAANVAKPTPIIESEKTRHQHPEIDDAGEFVRWTCCGDTNPNVYGCSVAIKSANDGRNLPRIFADVTTPKLLAAKLPNQELGRSMGFTIYDRGLSSKHDSGCRMWSSSLECWANRYEIPSNRWVNFTAAFDTKYLAIYFDQELVDCADVRVSPVPTAPPVTPRERVKRSDSQWIAAASTMNSVYIGGHPSYSRSVSEWRTRIGFVGLVGAFTLRAASADVVDAAGAARAQSSGSQANEAPIGAALGLSNQHRLTLAALRVPDVGKVRDASKFRQPVNCRRTLFWRREFPPLPQKSMAGMLLLGNFFHGGHNDLAVSNAKSFENLLLSVVQAADFRVIIEYALDSDFRVGHDYGCRSQTEYDQKSLALVRGIERMSPLLSVLVNEDKSGPTTPPIGSFEIRIELTRAVGREPVTIELHSMVSSGCFPNESEIKKKIEAIVLFEAKRPQGEEIYTQATRHFLALAERSRQNRERIFLESVINRKVVITERKIVALFQKLGFFFAVAEAHEVVKFFRSVQDNYSRNRGRIEDLPSLSMLSPTGEGLYSLPFLKAVSLSSTLTVDGSSKQSPWRFVCVLLDHDFQLVDFVREECPTTHDGALSYRQNRYSYGGFVDRLLVNLSALPGRVYCLLFSLTKRSGASESTNSDLEMNTSSQRTHHARVQFENNDTRHVLGMFDAVPTASCRWLTLGALYRAKKVGLWHLQALCHSGGANSLHGSVEDINALLCERQIVQTYEVRVYFAAGGSGAREFEEFAARFSENIRFGRNGCVAAIPVADSSAPTSASGVNAAVGDDKQLDHAPRLRIALKLQRIDSEIDVYTHEHRHHALPTVQSIYRSLLGVLLVHGIKESVQQNPFMAQERRTKRLVKVRVVSDRFNKPVEGAHVFVERNLEYGKLSTSLAKKIVPTLTMGSRLVSIRRRLQKNRFMNEVRSAATALVDEAIRLGSKVALLTLRRDSKLMPFVRSRTLLRSVMRRRYEKIRSSILHDVQQSEHARIYSRSAPIRLRQLLATSLEWSSSERDLMQQFSRDGLRVFDDELMTGTTDNAGASQSSNAADPSTVFAEWQAHKGQQSEQTAATEPSGASTMASNPSVASNVVYPVVNGTSMDSGEHGEGLRADIPNVAGKDDAAGALRLHKKHFVTDGDGVARCNLVPGTYTIYVFHVEFFEWTSVAVVYPSINTSGSYGGSVSSPATAQQVLIPLEEFRWSYNIQLVDFYQQHVAKRVTGIPLAITDKCGSHHSMTTTDGAGRAAWDVQKGLYSISAAPNCPCILYSAFKNIVVDGSRLRASHTVSVPVLFGKIKVDLAVVGVGMSGEAAAAAAITTIRLRKLSAPTQTQGFMDKSAADLLEMDSPLSNTTQLQLRLGTYCLEATARGCFTTSTTHMQVEWHAALAQARHLVVMTRAFTQPRTFRIVFSFVAQTSSNLSVVLEIWKDKTRLGFAWRRGAPALYRQHVKVESAERFQEWEYQSVVLTCHEGFLYKCLLAPNLHRFYTSRHCRPRVEVYSAAGSIYEYSFAPSTQPVNDFYLLVCSWNARGELILPDEQQRTLTHHHDSISE